MSLRGQNYDDCKLGGGGYRQERDVMVSYAWEVGGGGGGGDWNPPWIISA